MTGTARDSRGDYTEGLQEHQRILITGGSGFIGSNLVAAYRGAGVQVCNLDLSAPRRHSDREVWVACDVCDVTGTARIVKEFSPTHVVHLAARTDLEGSSLTDYPANTGGVTSLLNAVGAVTPRPVRVVVASSRMVCRIGHQPNGDDDYSPPNAYGASKVETERIVRACRQVSWVLVRPTSIWGPWFDVPYRNFFLAIARGRYLHPRGKHIPKSFGYVGNTTWQLHRLLVGDHRSVAGRTFYLADDPPLDVRDWANLISREMGRRTVREAPLLALRGVALSGDILAQMGRTPPLTTFRLDNLLTPMKHDLQAINSIARTRPYSLEDGVGHTVAWLRSQRLL